MNLKNISIEDRNAYWLLGVAGFYFAGLNICLYNIHNKDLEEDNIEYRMNEIDPEDSTVSRRDMPVLKYRHG